MSRGEGASRGRLSLMMVLVALAGLPAQVEGQGGTGSDQLDESWFQQRSGVGCIGGRMRP